MKAASTASSGADKEKSVDESITFQQLELAALYPDNRDSIEGKTVRLVGSACPKDARHFTLRRFKISCCAADAVPLNAVILIDPKATEDADVGPAARQVGAGDRPRRVLAAHRRRRAIHHHPGPVADEESSAD